MYRIYFFPKSIMIFSRTGTIHSENTFHTATVSQALGWVQCGSRQRGLALCSLPPFTLHSSHCGSDGLCLQCLFFLLVKCSQGEPETWACDFCVSWNEYILLGLGPSWLWTGLASSGGRRLKIAVGGTASSLGECDPVSPHVGEQDNNSCSIQSRKNNTQCPTISRSDSFSNLCPFPSFCFGLFEHKKLQIMDPCWII